MERIDNRNHNQLRDITIEPNVNIHAEGSVLISFGNTKVICNASIENNVPRWMKNSDEGWVTGEYGMLPRSTNERMNREAARGKQSGRTQEIQRLIGRSLRQAVDLKYLKASQFCYYMISEIYMNLQSAIGKNTAFLSLWFFHNFQ